MELVEAASSYVDEVMCVLPRTFPHKPYFGATLEQRIELLSHAAPGAKYSIAISNGGLFINVAREFRANFGPSAELFFLCGADAAERIVTWDYAHHGRIEEMLEEFQLLVAPRVTRYDPPGHLSSRVHALTIHDGHGMVSSTEVRNRIARGEPWEHLVPHPIVDRVREIYS